MMTEELGVRPERRGIFDRLGFNYDSLLVFFLILVIIFCYSVCFYYKNDVLQIFFFN